eukprot:gene14626-20660_t
MLSQLWSSMGLERKVMHIARRHFFPDVEMEEPSTSYKESPGLETGKGRGGRGFRSRSGQVRSSAMSASRKVREIDSDPVFSGGGPRSEFEACDPEDWPSSLGHAPDDSFAAATMLLLLQNEAEPSFCFYSQTHFERANRSARTRSRPNVAALLAAIDGGIEASNEAFALAQAAATATAATENTAALQIEAEPCPDVTGFLGTSIEVVAKKVKWQADDMVLNERGSGLPASTTHSGSSSQGGFALELSSPERISSRGWSPECSDDMN